MVVVVVLAVVALEAVYLVAANVALAVSTKRFASGASAGFAFDRGITWIPGRIHFRGLRVTARGGWTITIAECDVAFDVWRVVTSPRHIDTITADVSAVEFATKGATRRAKGAMHVVVKDIVVDDASVSFGGNAKVDETTFESDGVAFASGVHGTIDLRVAPVDVATRSLLDTATGTIALDGDFLSLVAVASLASLTTTQDRGTLHIAESLDGGHFGPSSEIRAHTAHATLNDGRGASAAFPRGLEIALRPMANAFQLEARTPSLVFGSADATRPPDTFDDFELIVPTVSAAKSLSWSARHVSFHEGATTLDASVDGSLQFDKRDDKSFVANAGDIRATKITAENPEVTNRTPFDAHLVLDRLTVSREQGIGIGGQLHASGDDATPVFELFVSSPSIRRELTTLPKHAFTLDATLERSESRFALDNLTLARGEMTVRGGYVRHDAQSSGAFLVRGGVLPIGITMNGKDESIVLAPASGWLERQRTAP